MKFKRVILAIVLFLVVWYVFNVLPVIPVTYNLSPQEMFWPSYYHLPNACSLNFMFSCYNDISDFGVSYPRFLKNSVTAFFLVLIVLPLLVTWLLFRIITKKVRYFKNQKKK